MTTILLDANVYDKLRADGQSRASLRALVDRGLAKVIVTPMVLQGLQRSPFGGLPDWFPVTVEAENLTVLNYAPLGMTGLGEGVVYDEHRGESKKIPNAIIADSANALADILVLEDRRCRERLKKISARCTSLDYEQFGNGYVHQRHYHNDRSSFGHAADGFRSWLFRRMSAICRFRQVSELELSTLNSHSPAWFNFLHSGRTCLALIAEQCRGRM